MCHLFVLRCPQMSVAFNAEGVINSSKPIDIKNLIQKRSIGTQIFNAAAQHLGVGTLCLGCDGPIKTCPPLVYLPCKLLIALYTVWAYREDPSRKLGAMINSCDLKVIIILDN